MRLHSKAKVMYFPQSKTELKDLVDQLTNNNTVFHIVSGGSNIIFAEYVHTPIINLMEVDSAIEYFGDKVKVGCSVRIQKLIRDLQNHEMGGIEYLFSVPTSIGGAVYMNAGRGKSFGLAISDFLEEVEYYSPQDKCFKTYQKQNEDFSYRVSPFQQTDYIITSAIFCFKKQPQEQTEQLIQARMEHSRKHLSAEKPSCGSVFCEGNRLIYRLLMGRRCGGAIYSKKTPDWITNEGNATAKDVMSLINKGVRWHRVLRSDCKMEIKYFE